MPRHVINFELAVHKELEKIYKEMGKWPTINKRLNYIIPKDEVRRGEAFLIGREVLHKLALAKKFKDRLAAGNLHKNNQNLRRS